MEQTSRGARVAPWTLVLAGYVLTRVGFIAVAGVRFDATSLDWFWQYIDPALLADDALRSVFHHHAQPPLYNLYLAANLKLFAGSPLAFWIGSLLAGVALHLGLYGLLRELGVGAHAAVVAAIAFAASPVSILYESWLFYTHPLAALLVLAAWSLARLVRGGGRTADAWLFAAILGAAALTRSLFHPIWLLGALALPLLSPGVDRRRVATAALLPILLVAAVVVKNGLLFESWSTSSWMGKSLARLALVQTPLGQRRVLAANGVLSEIATVRPFSPLGAYPPAWRTPRGPDHPVLRAARKTSGHPNFNHGAYLAISEQYRRDSLAMIARAPARYFDAVTNAWLIYAMPPSDYTFMKDNRARIAGWDRVWSCVVYGACTSLRHAEGTALLERREALAARFTWTWSLALLAALAAAGFTGLRNLRRRAPSAAATLLFIAGTIVFVACAGNFMEIGENNRFRAMLEPISWALLVWAGHGLWHALRARTTPDGKGDTAGGEAPREAEPAA